MSILKILKELDNIVTSLKSKIIFLENENKELELKLYELKKHINNL